MKMEMIQLETVIGTVLGGGLTAGVARYLILKALNDLSKVIEKVDAINAKLSAIEVKLGYFEKFEETSASHDRQIIEIQSRLKYERPNAHIGSDQARVRPT